MCDPCQFCQHIYDDSDPSVGMEGYGCSYYDGPVEDDGWEPGCGRPCKGFKPWPTSDHLVWQLRDEEEARQWKEWQDELDSMEEEE